MDVEVDPETGKTDVTRFTAFQDVGKAIHPSYVEGQMQGGSVQGIGWALNEEYYMNADGGMDNTSLLDYRMPTSLDLPMIDTVIVEVANPGHPFGGARSGRGEHRSADARRRQRGARRHRHAAVRDPDELGGHRGRDGRQRGVAFQRLEITT